ncbi:MAG TPA: glycosyltransferase [Thermoleophilaceae bacterium]|nr:glycosyltransferase [Thermoleophilaceae bacterium]
MSRPAISVVVPAYNEEAAIASTVRALRDWLEAHGEPWEILVVDNASEDRTAAVVEELADGERVRLLRNERNRGKGHSMRRGMLEATGELRLHCDADCAASLPSLPNMLELVRVYDVVVGSRLAEGARVGRRQRLRRRLAGRSFQQLCRLVLREPTTDLYCGFKLWRSHAAVDTYSRTRLEGWTFDAEVLAMARALGYGIRETGIVWTDREGSRVRMGRILLPVLGELLAARRNVRREARRGRAAEDAPLAEPAET